ncbi:hypothetical protein [Rhodococcus opacus]|uniref:hypothetical protein n=1 Tax=Rhodococcus opacus TaxID=37919 RepID=UPI00155A41C5|nr:hypothetical protein [Rhodococcus opacus]
MKVVRHHTSAGPTLAVQLDEETIADLPHGLDLAALVATDGLLHDAGDQARRTGKRRPLAGAKLMAPLDTIFSEGDALAGVRRRVAPSSASGMLAL